MHRRHGTSEIPRCARRDGERPAGRVTIVVAIRADLYGRCAELPELAALLGGNHVLVGPMTADEYRRAIEQPAMRVGVHVESALTEALVAEVGDEPGALPLLSTALLELWTVGMGARSRSPPTSRQAASAVRSPAWPTRCTGALALDSRRSPGR